MQIRVVYLVFFVLVFFVVSVCGGIDASVRACVRVFAVIVQGHGSGPICFLAQD